MADPFEELAAAQRTMQAADKRRKRAAKRHREATTAVKAAYHERLAKLRVATADRTPETMKHAAEVMGISTPRVYQLLSEDNERRAAEVQRPGYRREHHRP
jgi:hypothetical protein